MALTPRVTSPLPPSDVNFPIFSPPQPLSTEETLLTPAMASPTPATLPLLTPDVSFPSFSPPLPLSTEQTLVTPTMALPPPATSPLLTPDVHFPFFSPSLPSSREEKLVTPAMVSQPPAVNFPYISPSPPSPAREILETRSITFPSMAPSALSPQESLSPPSPPPPEEPIGSTTMIPAKSPLCSPEPWSPPLPPPTEEPVGTPTPSQATSPLSPPSPPPLPQSTIGSKNLTSPRGQGKGGLSPGMLAVIVGGIVISVAIVLAAVGIFVIFYKRRKRKHAAQNLPSYGPKSDHFTGPHQQQNASPPRDYQGPMLPKPSRTTGFAPNAPLSPVSGSSSTKPPSTSSSIDSDQPFRPLSHGIFLGNFKSTFTYEELKIATDNFSDANFLGQGGFGYVHKGVLADGKVVAIKQLKAGSGQGEREFRAEIEIISRVHHRHLVSLVGYCIFGAQRLLVYEFVPNKTLEFHLHGKERPVMNWPTRMKIALGSARGLAYLHEDCHPKIIHRDIKAANILLDNSFEPKVADFGLAKYFLDTDTHISTQIKGTIGYLAPEYAATGQLTEKSDVFSFGVLLLELITGYRPSDKTNSSVDEGIVDWAKPLLAQALVDGKFDAVADSKLQEHNSAEMERMAACAAACTRHSKKLRPPMSQIVRCLEGNIPLDELKEGITPGHSAIYYSYGYREDVKKFKKIALESVDQGSSDCSRLPSDYGQDP